MKRGLSFLMVVGAIASFPVSDIVYAQGRPTPPGQERMYICHFPGQKPIGRILNVSGVALPQHLDMHGDLEFPLYTALGGHRSGKAKLCEVAELVGFCKLRSDESWTLGLIPPQNVDLALARGDCLATEPNEPSITSADVEAETPCSCD